MPNEKRRVEASGRGQSSIYDTLHPPLLMPDVFIFFLELQIATTTQNDLADWTNQLSNRTEFVLTCNKKKNLSSEKLSGYPRPIKEIAIVSIFVDDYGGKNNRLLASLDIRFQKNFYRLEMTG
jgi:hypothetical protein